MKNKLNITMLSFILIFGIQFVMDKNPYIRALGALNIIFYTSALLKKLGGKNGN